MTERPPVFYTNNEIHNQILLMLTTDDIRPTHAEMIIRSAAMMRQMMKELGRD